MNTTTPAAQSIPDATDETFSATTLAETLTGRDGLIMFVLDASGKMVPATYLEYVYTPDGEPVGFCLKATR